MHQPNHPTLRRLTKSLATGMAALAAATVLSACQAGIAVDETTTDSPTKVTNQTETTPTRTTKGDAGQGTALAALQTLPVKGRAPMTGYDRSQFGAEWSDAAGDFTWTRNGCDTKNDVRARDLQREVVETNGCVVVSGVLAYEPYSGTRDYYFDKTDNDYSTDLDTEHFVALGNAWVTGAQQLTPEQRAALANDPDNLAAVDPSLNRQKGDADAATWLPPNKSFRCSYVARQVRVKKKYDLAVTAPEKTAMEKVLATCPGEPLDQPEVQAGYTAKPAAASAPHTSNPSATASTKATPKHEARPSPASKVSKKDSGTRYANCDAVRAAGAAPIHKGDPGYSGHLDRDGDGTACE